MEIPRPRLKALQELDAEEKVAEKAVLAIRRKTLQVDSDLERIREEVEGELERLDTQRSQLEENMQQLMEEQAMILTALSGLEDRQGKHKQNLSMLKEEEFEIETERKELNIALKQLRGKQRNVREMVGKKYLTMDSSKYGKRYAAINAPDNSFKREPRQFLSEEPVFQKWRSQGMEERQEPNVKIVASPMFRDEEESYKQPGVPNLQEAPESGQLNAPVQASAGQPSAEKPPTPEGSAYFAQISSSKSKPGILKRMRFAADRYLPEPFRFNKPQIAILEEKAEQAESAVALETSSTIRAEKSKSPSEKENRGSSTVNKVKALDAPGLPDAIEREILEFEEKLEGENEEEPMPADALKSRISGIVRMGRGSQIGSRQTYAMNSNKTPDMPLPSSLRQSKN
ncbi:MAG: hypothetical protein ABH863_02010, partial [Candidatus Micrarchaeota archaeon]